MWGGRAGKELAGLRIFLVDDMRDNTEALAAVFQMLGADVGCATSGAEALASPALAAADVIVLDISMPYMDGLELMKNIRARSEEDGGRVPAIALSGHHSEELVTACREAGFTLALRKPAEPTKLVQLVLVLGAPGRARREERGTRVGQARHQDLGPEDGESDPHRRR